MSETTELIAQQILNGNINKRTWGDILYNVKVYGAVGDGVKDDTAAIQSAIDAAIANGSKNIFFPHGTYKVTGLTGLSSVILLGDNSVFSGITTTIAQFGAPPQSIVLNVRDYGAKGDGVKDDSTSIQNAIDDAYASGGGIVFFPPGVYSCAMILMKDKVSLKGANETFDYEYDLGPSRLVATVGPHWLLRGNGAKHVGINNLTLVGQDRYTHGIDANIRCLQISCCQWAGFDYAIGQLNPTEGYGQQWHIFNNAIFNNNTGVKLSYDSKLFDNFIYTCKLAVEMNSSANCIENNKIEFNDIHIMMNPAERCTIANNIFDHAENEGINLDANSRDITFVGNTFMAAGMSTANDWQKTHIRINGASRITFSGNSFVKNYWEDGLKPEHIVTGATSTGVIFKGNNMSNACSGDLISSPSDIRLKGNLGTFEPVTQTIIGGGTATFTFWVDAMLPNSRKSYNAKFAMQDLTTTSITAAQRLLQIDKGAGSPSVGNGTIIDLIGTGTIGSNITLGSWSISSDGSKMSVVVTNVNASSHSLNVTVSLLEG